jgi:hypothetical protein
MILRDNAGAVQGRLELTLPLARERAPSSVWHTVSPSEAGSVPYSLACHARLVRASIARFEFTRIPRTRCRERSEAAATV